MKTKTITIVGGGVAGLSLGIALRRRDIPVVVWEAGRYPRHKVCGEFINGRGQETLARLGLPRALDRAGAVSASTAAFIVGRRSTAPLRLPENATCLSRYRLDAVLADEFLEAGGVLHAGQRWECGFDEGVVQATGRRRAVEGKDSEWWGVKVHVRNVALIADVEMHVSSRGYVGLCRLGGGVVNVCGLFRRRVGGGVEAGAARRARLRMGSWLSGLVPAGLAERLREAEFDESSYCAVAGMSLRPQRAAAGAGVRIGDRLTMIPPITGNGMSMALESAELAMEPLVAWARGAQGWPQARAGVAASCDRAFSARLAWAKWLQILVLSPVFGLALPCMRACGDGLWRCAFARTR
jgi:flavin-dependent dehydrogenase